METIGKVSAFLTELLGPSWRTTVFGFIVAVGNLVLNGVSWKNALISSTIQVAGLLMKDAQAHSTVAEVEKATDDKAAEKAA